MRRTKIVATIGPATRNAEMMRALIEVGVDVVRLNFAHDAITQHRETARMARDEAAKQGRIVGVLADLPGPKMRTGPISGGFAEISPGDHFTLTSDSVEGDSTRVSTTVDDLAAIVSVGDETFLADGQVVLRVQSIDGGDVVTEVVRGGTLRSRKGLHLPSAETRMEAFTPEDQEILQTAVEMEVDLVGLSFIRDSRDVDRVRAALPADSIRPQLVAKIETASAVENLDDIIDKADAVMVARGDLGIQVPLRRVPILQKQIIRACNRAGKPVITATEMLESMTDEPLPSRAEATDVANAVFDGTDALMLSEETAIGRYPIEAVRTMSEISETADTAKAAETLRERRSVPEHGSVHDDDRVAWAAAHAAVEAAQDVSAAAILSVTRAGSTPRRVAAYRPSVPIGGVSGFIDCLGALALSWGVRPLRVGNHVDATTIKEEIDRAVLIALESGFVKPGELVVVVAGSPGPRAGATDFMQVTRAG